MFAALVITGVVSRFASGAKSELPFVLELPPYRLPSIRPILRMAINRSKHFVTKAGKVILAVTIAVWVLGYFPNGGTDLGTSWLGMLGHWIQPLFEPMGLDWRYGVAILSSFLAREVFVGTLGTIFGIEGADDNMLPLVEQIQGERSTLGFRHCAPCVLRHRPSVRLYGCHSVKRGFFPLGVSYAGGVPGDSLLASFADVQRG